MQNDDLIDAYVCVYSEETVGGEDCQKGFHTNNNIKSWKIDIDIVNSGLITNTYMWKKSHFIVSIFLHIERVCFTCFKTIHDEILFL